MVDGFYQVASG